MDPPLGVEDETHWARNNPSGAATRTKRVDFMVKVEGESRCTRSSNRAVHSPTGCVESGSVDGGFSIA